MLFNRDGANRTQLARRKSRSNLEGSGFAEHDRCSVFGRISSRFAAVEGVNHLHRASSGECESSRVGKCYGVARTVRLLRLWDVIAHIVSIEANVSVVQAAFEVGVVLLVQFGPADFSHSEDAREDTVVAHFFGVHIFRPSVALNAKDILLFVHCHKGVRHWVVAVGLFQEGVTAY